MPVLHLWSQLIPKYSACSFKKTHFRSVRWIKRFEANLAENVNIRTAVIAVKRHSTFLKLGAIIAGNIFKPRNFDSMESEMHSTKFWPKLWFQHYCMELMFTVNLKQFSTEKVWECASSSLIHLANTKKTIIFKIVFRFLMALHPQTECCLLQKWSGIHFIVLCCWDFYSSRCQSAYI